MEQQLMALAGATVYPPTPDLAAGFWRRLEAERARQAPASPFSLAAVGIAAAVVAFALIIGVVTPVREAAADLFDRINIFETNESLEDFPTGIVGDEVTIDQAEFELGRRILQPTYPDGAELERVVLQDFGSTKAVALFYTAGDERFVLFATNSRVGKGLPDDGGSTQEPVAIPLKEVGFWLTGDHLVQLRDEDGRVIAESERVTDANTLIWPEDDFIYKIEGDIPQAEAIAIAASVGPAEAVNGPRPTAGPTQGYWITCVEMDVGFLPKIPRAGEPAVISLPAKDPQCADPRNNREAIDIVADVYLDGTLAPAYIEPTSSDRGDDPELQMTRIAPGYFRGEFVFPEPGEWHIIFRDVNGASGYIFYPHWSQKLGPFTVTE